VAVASEYVALADLPGGGKSEGLRAVLGSTAHKVIHLTDRSVLVVR